VRGEKEREREKGGENCRDLLKREICVLK